MRHDSAVWAFASRSARLPRIKGKRRRPIFRGHRVVEDLAFRGFAVKQVEDEDVGEGMDGIGPTTSTKCARNSC